MNTTSSPRASASLNSTSALDDLINSAAGKGSSAEGITLPTFFASLSVAALIFLVQFLLFLALKGRLIRVYSPRTYLVPDTERVEPAPPGLFGWLVPVFKTSNEEFLSKCGMDAYFFIRYLRTLLKIFIPLALVILPILLPLNAVGGRGPSFGREGHYAGEEPVAGLDQLAFGNVHPERTSRYWAHLILAVVVVVYVCYIFFVELRAFIRLRQHYLTTPQHRLRASATTVLVTGIPPRYQSVEALDAMYDVFPGGIRNIWLNRNYDPLAEKVAHRNKLCRQLEAAETELIKKVHKAHARQAAQEAKRQGLKTSRADKAERRREADAAAVTRAQGDGTSAGDPHQVKHTIYEATHDEAGQSLARSPKPWSPVPVVGQGLVGVGRGFNRLGQTVRQGLAAVQRGVEERLDTTGGLVPETSDRDGSEWDSAGPSGPGPRPTPRTASEATDHTVNRPEVPSSRDPATSAAHGSTAVPVAPGTHERSVAVDGAVEKPSNPRWMFWSRGREKTEDRLGPRPWVPTADVRQAGTENKSVEAGARSNGVVQEKAAGSRPGSAKPKDEVQYPKAYDERYADDQGGEPKWRKYLTQGDRETMREPLFGKLSWPGLPLVCKKVDKIYWLRKKLAQLNVEIEYDQANQHRFPLMNSAFIQFNSQLAAHMACQSVSHHLPKQMAPRLVEISPDDVIWNNMSLRWWERYVRTTIILVLVVGLSIAWAIPVTFTGLLSQINNLTRIVPWLGWIEDLPDWLLSFIQGVLPQVLLALLLALLPAMLRFLSTQQGMHTGNGVELSVQNYFFIFLFVQVFLIVSISSGITSAMRSLVTDLSSAPSILAVNLPGASNYFFSYMLIQALSVSSGALLQLGALIGKYILAPIVDSTPRQKWAREMTLSTVTWGTFFPVYTNLAAIGLIYSVISPLILVFNIVTFGLFWIVYRYNTLYVVKFRSDTGGLLYPRAINQLFTGLYVMELCLIGLFFLVRDAEEKVACRGQAIVMIAVTILTGIYQYLLNEAFSPLYKYIPVSLEDMAVEADREFAKLLEKATLQAMDERRPSQSNSRGPGAEHNGGRQEDDPRRLSSDANKEVGVGGNGAGHDGDSYDEEYERLCRQNALAAGILQQTDGAFPAADRPLHPASFLENLTKRSRPFYYRARPPPPGGTNNTNTTNNHQQQQQKTKTMTANEHMKKYQIDAENQRQMDAGRGLFLNVHDRLEDLSQEERDVLVARAFQHEALRAKRPVVWIPRDALGIADDEIYRTQLLTKHVWISNEFTALDARGRILYSRSPPDFSEVDLIKL